MIWFQVLALLKPVIRTRGYPTSLCALKLAAEVAKARPHELSDDIVGHLMEGVGQVLLIPLKVHG